MGGRDLSFFFQNQLKEFAAAIHGNPSRIASALEGVQLIEILDRALQSARQNSSTAIDPNDEI